MISKHRCVHLKQRNGCVNPVQLCITSLLCTQPERVKGELSLQLCVMKIPSILAAVCLPGNTFSVRRLFAGPLFFVQTVNDLSRRLASIFKRNTSAARSLREKHREKKNSPVCAPWRSRHNLSRFLHLNSYPGIAGLVDFRFSVFLFNHISVCPFRLSWGLSPAIIRQSTVGARVSATDQPQSFLRALHWFKSTR